MKKISWYRRHLIRCHIPGSNVVKYVTRAGSRIFSGGWITFFAIILAMPQNRIKKLLSHSSGQGFSPIPERVWLATQSTPLFRPYWDIQLSAKYLAGWLVFSIPVHSCLLVIVVRQWPRIPFFDRHFFWSSAVSLNKAFVVVTSPYAYLVITANLLWPKQKLKSIIFLSKVVI